MRVQSGGNPSAVRHHLVVLHEKYLQMLLAGDKQIECRLSSDRRPPFGRVADGDLLWLKLPSRPIHAVATAGHCLFRELADGGDLARTAREFGRLIGAPGSFYEDAAPWARYCSLIWIETVVRLRPMPVSKSDTRAWVVLDGMPWPGMRLGRPQRCPTTLP